MVAIVPCYTTKKSSSSIPWLITDVSHPDCQLSFTVKVSEEDLEWMSNDPWHKVGETWSMRGPELVVVTRGGDGVAAFKGGKQLTALPSVPVELVDTVGAGDTYMAWLLAGALNGDLEDAALHKTLSLAAKAAAINCSRKGCQPPRQSEVLP